MSGFRRPEVDREQLVLWSHRLDDAVATDHPVRLFDVLLRSPAFAKTFEQMERDYVLVEGKPPYHPRYLAGVYLYGMLSRIRSSRQLETACYNRLDVIWLMEGQHPDHSTIAAFTSQQGAALRKLLHDTVAVGLKAKLITLEQVAVDGTKVEADAGRGSVRSQEKIASWLQHLDEHIAALEQEWATNERCEAGLWDGQASWAPPSSSDAAKRLQALQRKQEQLRQALEQIERRQAEAQAAGSKPPKAIASTTDPDSRSMKDKEGRCKPNYNGQVGVDTAHGMVVSTAVNDHPEDQGQLMTMVTETEATCRRLPAAVSADSGYHTGPDLAKLEERGVEGYVAEGAEEPKHKSVNPLTAEQLAAREDALRAVRQGAELTEAQWAALPQEANGQIAREAFVYDASRDAYRCPTGWWIPLLTTSSDIRRGGRVQRGRYGFETQKGSPAPCSTCLYASRCCRQPARGRTLSRDEYEAYRERMRARMSRPESRAIYKRRRETVEPRIGMIKQVLGVRKFLRRGVEKVRTEWSMVCTALNIRVLLNHWPKVVGALNSM